MIDEDVMLTTVDNPWNPFFDWDDWRQFDEAAGHHTLALLGRITLSSEELSEADQELAILEAMKEIVTENVSGVHVLISHSAERFPKRE